MRALLQAARRWVRAYAVDRLVRRVDRAAARNWTRHGQERR